jgi:alpha-L-arabinofuranosidase
MLGAAVAFKAWPANTLDQEIEIFPEEQIGVIQPALHGHFAAYPGAFLDGGLWVGRDSPIPNINGFREVSVEQLRALGIPVLRWPGDGRRDFAALCELIGARPYLGGDAVQPDTVTEEAILHYRKTGLAVQTQDRTAVKASVSLNVLQRQADKVTTGLAPLDALLSIQGDKSVRTAVYYAFLLAKPHRGNISVKASPPQANALELSISASRRDSSVVITVVNPRTDADVRIHCLLHGHKPRSASARTVTEYSTGLPQKVDVLVRPEGLRLELSALSATTIRLELEAG